MGTALFRKREEGMSSSDEVDDKDTGRVDVDVYVSAYLKSLETVDKESMSHRVLMLTEASNRLHASQLTLQDEMHAIRKGLVRSHAGALTSMDA